MTTKKNEARSGIPECSPQLFDDPFNGPSTWESLDP